MQSDGNEGGAAAAVAVTVAAIVVVLAAGTAVLRPFADGSVDRSSQLLRAAIGALVAVVIAAAAVVLFERLSAHRGGPSDATSPPAAAAGTRRLGRSVLAGGLTGASLALLAFTTVAVGATAGIATVDVRPNAPRPASTVPVERPASTPTPPPIPPKSAEVSSRSVRLPDWLGIVFAAAAALVAAFALVIGVRSIRVPTVRLLGRLIHGADSPTTVEEPATIDLDAAAESFAESAAVIDDDGDPRRAIIAAYAHLLRRLGDAGCTRRPDEAPEEHLRRSLRELSVPHESMELVVAKFLVARFSRHEVTEADRDRVRDALRAAGADLRIAIEHHAVPA